MKRVFLIICWGIAGACLGKAQSYRPIRLTHYTTVSGLGSSNVRKTIEDTKGFIWSATQDGLYKFTGNKFTPYNTSTHPFHQLEGSAIRDMLISGERLWVITAYGGINAINTIDGKVVYRFDQQKDKWYNDVLLESLAIQNDTLFIGGSKGLILLKTQDKNGAPVPVTLSTGSVPKPTYISRLILDRENYYLWLFCPGQGVYLLNSKTLSVISFLPDKEDFVYDCDFSAGHILFAATSKGIRKYSVSKNKIVRVDMPFPGIQQTLATDIYAIKYKGTYLYFSNKNYLMEINLADNHYRFIKESSFGKSQDWTEAVFGINFDKDDHLWLSCQQGLAFSDNRPPPFISFIKSSVSEDVINHSYGLFPYSDSIVYASAEDGLYEVNTVTGRIKTMDKEKTYFFSFRDLNNNLIVSNDEGTFLQGKKVAISWEKKYPEFIGKGKIILNSCIAIGDSMYVLGSQNKRGIFLWNFKKKTVVNINKESHPLSLHENVINTVYKDKAGMLWILSDNSVMLYDLAKQKISYLPLIDPVNKNFFTIFFDITEMGNRFYIASYGQGVIVLDKDRRIVNKISVDKGLANNGVYKLLNYKDSLLLATTNNGLSVINRRDYSVKNYFVEDGMHSSEFEESSGSSRKNIFYAGGAGGFTMINPSNFTINNTPPLLYWNTVSVETPLGTKDTSNLGFKLVEIPNNAIQTNISFCALNYNNPLRTAFAYKIKELHKDWINIGHRDFINLIGLNPGKYTLQVKASNEDGVWTESPIELVLDFLPKWFQTWWFKTLVGLAIATLLYALYRYRVKQIIKLERIRQKISADLHDDIGSTLSSVNLFTKMAIMQPEKKEYLPHIDQGIQNVISGVRDIIWILDKHAETVESIFNRVTSFSESLSKAAGSEFQVNIEDAIKQYSLSGEEKRNTYLVIKEAINNSIKYSGCSLITLTAKHQNRQIVIAVSDNGKGLINEASGNISVSEAGSGNGLKNMHLRCEEIKWKLSIISEAGIGTTVCMRGKFRG